MKTFNHNIKLGVYLVKHDNAVVMNLNQKTYLGLDYGSKVIGLARFRQGDPLVQQWGRIIPSTIRPPHNTFSVLTQLLVEEEITDIVIGISFHRDGNPTPITLAIEQFVSQWKEYLATLKKPIATVQFHWQDETLTTIEAKSRQKEAGKIDLKTIDSLSAVIILEDFLRAQDPTSV